MKEFFIQHTEKLVLGLSALIAVWFLYSALTVQQYDKSPQDFQDLISRASQNVRKSEPKIDDLATLDFAKDLEKINKPVEASAYALKNPFIRPLELGFQFRGTPLILAPKFQRPWSIGDSCSFRRKIPTSGGMRRFSVNSFTKAIPRN